MAVNYALQDKFLEVFFSNPLATDFYLTGGTALARFYFNHRESVDLDLFTNNQKLDFSQISFLVNKIGQELELKIIQQMTTSSFIQFILVNLRWCEKQKSIHWKILAQTKFWPFLVEPTTRTLLICFTY